MSRLSKLSSRVHKASNLESVLTFSCSSKSISAIVTLVVGQEQRIFAAHENVLGTSPFFQNILQNQMMDSQTKKISLPDEEPEVFSSILEYLYKGDYYPRLVHNKKRNSWELEQNGDEGRPEAAIYHHSVEGDLLKDTAIYCSAEKYGLEELKRVSLRKQGLRMSHFPLDLPLPPSLTLPRVRNPSQHYPGLCPVRLCQHARYRLQAAGPLPRPHHPQPQHLQAERHDAAGDVQRQHPTLFRPLCCLVQSC